MKRTASDLDLEGLLLPVVDSDGRSPSPAELEDLLLPRRSSNNKISRVFGGADGDGDGDEAWISFADGCGFGFIGDRDGSISNLAAGGQLTGNHIWTQSHNISAPRHSSISTTIESPNSVWAGSPTSSLKPKGAPGGTSGSDQSDDESIEIGAGPCDQSANGTNLKRMRRLVSNRLSARRSRTKKQAQQADLESQVDQLRGENALLYKQLTGANHEFTEAVTDNRVLKSDVGTLRVKVKMAEDMVTRGSLTCSLDHLLQSQTATPNLLNALNMCRASEVLPIVDLQANEGCYIGASATRQSQIMGIEGGETKRQSSAVQSIPGFEDMQSRLSDEITSSGSDIWPWGSHDNMMSKQF